MAYLNGAHALFAPVSEIGRSLCDFSGTPQWPQLLNQLQQSGDGILQDIHYPPPPQVSNSPSAGEMLDTERRTFSAAPATTPQLQAQGLLTS